MAEEGYAHVLRGLISYHERMTMGNYPERDFYLNALRFALECVEDRLNDGGGEKMEKVLDVKTVVEWLRKCSKNGDTCQGCPYDDPDYENGCGRLLADAAQLLAQAYPAEGPGRERTCKERSKVCIADEGSWTEGKKE